MGADRKANTRWLWFERQAAYSSDCSVELPLRPSARATPPLGPRPLLRRLRAEECGWWLGVSMGAGMKANTTRQRTRGWLSLSR